ncbi:BgTH12-01708 [Blumeria graminis f. sp. triticale]|uniref:BgTH12-01708 n=1 Tax=Blumeria graminis f. sp. triticale TaxID=1689686 RepID=A0A9W4GE64_BLUGR|nr:BgTH12-01708 [Blumeria graminis f. sp. triticale]
MEGGPIAQTENGQPYVSPSTNPGAPPTSPDSIISAAWLPQAENAAVNGPVSVLEATSWSTQVVTATDVYILVSTSILTTTSTSVAISTTILNEIATSITTVTNSEQPTISSSTETSLVSSTSAASSQNSSSPESTLSSSAEVTSSSSTNLAGGSSTFITSTRPPVFLSIPTSSNSMMPDHTSLSMTTGNNSHDHLAKLMGGMVAGIFGIAAILALGLLFFRRRAQRLSESQANVGSKKTGAASYETSHCSLLQHLRERVIEPKAYRMRHYPGTILH